MPTIVLVPGGWGGAWEWVFVARLLRGRGNDVYPLTLTGLGDRAHLAVPDVSLVTHAQDVLAVLDMEDLTDVVLCGHSYGGMVVTEATGRDIGRIAATLYLDAVVPNVGESLFDCVGSGLAQLLAETAGSAWSVPCPWRYQDGDLPEGRPRWYNDRSRPQPVRTFTDPVTSAPRSAHLCGYVRYLGSTGEQELFLRQSAQRARDRGWWMRDIATIHDGHVTDPESVAAVIEDFARDVAPT